MRIPKSVLKAIREVEQAHFRTVHDTGANPTAMLVMNTFRSKFGLPNISVLDLPAWNDKKKQYVKPRKSRLLSERKEITKHVIVLR